MSFNQVPGVRSRETAELLQLDRLPGEFGPILRCSGPLSALSGRAIGEELNQLAPMGHSVVTVNVSRCGFIDVDGLIALLEGCRRLRRIGTRMVLVAGANGSARMLRALGIDEIIPVFPSEEVAATALRGAGPRDPSPRTWQDARARTLARWRLIRESVGHDPEEALRLMTSMFALCDRAEQLYEETTPSAPSRCQFCPLFHSLGGRQADVGCRSVIDPIINEVRASRVEEAKSKIDRLIQMIEDLAE